ncbi:TPA: hypothetical protein N0F65_009998 [Lagenidium giganteum]|uniref:Peptidyl-prolyl cis-trans isomerase n=1 Tax=Lagenidium giganteum TaxID=4803 RepID=A0AAV2ZCD1_9STRA|nr:TPA: hypothetical protein N0F65_009998 [Lagenidium giganteum]
MDQERSCIFETRVERAAACRDRGSTQFKSGNVLKAIEWYERALYHVDFDEGTWHFEFMDNHRNAVNEVRLPVYLNLAACYLNAAALDYSKVVENADEALKIDAKNAKALYRGGKAHLMQGNLDQARKLLRQAVQSQPNDRSIREALQLLAEKAAEQKQREKQTWGGRLLSETTEASDSDGDVATPSAPPAKVSASQGEQAVQSSAWTITTILVLVLAVIAGVVAWYFGHRLT